MDISEFFSVYQPFTSPPRKSSDYKSENSIMSQSRMLNINEVLFQALFPSEDTVKTYLDPTKYNNDDNKSDCDQTTNSSDIEKMDLDKFYFKKSPRFGSKTEPDYRNLHELASASTHSDTINEVISRLVNHYNLSLEILDYNGYGNPEPYYQYYDDYRASLSNQLFTYNDYVKLRGNTCLFARLGYKFTLTLNTDNDKVQEAWNPKVTQQILSVYYSPLNLKKDPLTTQSSLDHCESLILAEMVNAFQDDGSIKLPNFESKFKVSPSPSKFVSIFRRIDSFKKLSSSDKIMLLSCSFYEVVSMDTVFKYNHSTDEWINPEYGTRFGRRDLFLWYRVYYDATMPVIETLPDKWRNDEVVEALISMIIVFNPDLVGLEFPDPIRCEQYFYIHLLKRYLESVCKSSCDASDNLYRLLVAVGKFRDLGVVGCKQINDYEPGYHRSLRNLIIKGINNEQDLEGYTQFDERLFKKKTERLH